MKLARIIENITFINKPWKRPEINRKVSYYRTNMKRREYDIMITGKV